jgi:hypothetical protein
LLLTSLSNGSPNLSQTFARNHPLVTKPNDGRNKDVSDSADELFRLTDLVASFAGG